MQLQGSEALYKAIEDWDKEGLLMPGSAHVLRERYPMHAPVWYRSTSSIVRIVAGLLLTAGIVLLISENWHHLGIPARMSIGFVPWLASSILAVRETQRGRKRASELWSFISTLLFGVNIFLQAQIFHLSGYVPTALLWWCIGTLLLAIVQHSRLILSFSFLLAGVWIGSETLSSQTAWPLGGVLIAHLLLGWRMPTRTTLVGCVALTVLSIDNLWSYWNVGSWMSQCIYIVCSAIATLIVLRFPVQQESFRRKLLWILAAGGACIAQTLTGSQGQDRSLELPGLLVIILSLVVSGGILLADKSIRSVALCSLMGWAALWYSSFRMLWPNSLSIGIDAITFLFAILLIRHGIRSQDKANFMAGVSTIFYLAGAKFFDFAGNYLAGAVVFMIAGLMLVVSNEYWKRRYATN
ncbi:MAG: DUF2157 domain-containing protein [Candidatus Kapabacteria bacterium]|jgi:uncharacterized membrane protein|nr:DUF2157 domain-containing protein [Candidatus Kapabacteria bacterium]